MRKMNSMAKHNQDSISQDQAGIVSLIVVMIIMAIITLVSVGFAFLMTREQRQVLDRKLSTEAFYAAESGVHDVAAQINSITNSITDCANTPGKASGLNILSPASADDVSYTCVLVNKTPQEIVKDPVSTDQSFVVRLESGTGPIRQIDIGWQDSADGGTGNLFVPVTNNSHLLPQKNTNDNDTNPLTDPNGTGVVQASVMPIRSSAANAITRANLVSDARTYFLYPRSGGAGAAKKTVSWASDDAKFINGNCNDKHPNKLTHPSYCNIEINNIGNNNGVVYLRLRAIYRPVAINVKIHDNTGAITPVINAQAVIDSTGKAQDVLRRIQVRVPLSGDYLFPEDAITSLDTICKRAAFPQSGAGFINELPVEDSTPNSLGKIYYDKSKDSLVCDPTRP